MAYFFFDEKTKTLTANFDSIGVKGNKVIRVKRYFDKIFFLGYYGVPNEFIKIPFSDMPKDFFEHQDFWIQYKKKTIKFDSFPYSYIDKYFQVNFSSNGEYIICSPYTDVTAGYDPEEDNKVYVYDLKNIDAGVIKKQTVNCERCLNSFLIRNNYFLFVKELPIGQGYDGFYKNVYIAPANSIADTIRVAHEINIRSVTPDGKFILGEKYLLGKYAPVVVNVETKKFQYILGRDYPLDRCYYSIQEKKFAFMYERHIVYIEYPDEYPFNALGVFNTKKSTKVEREAFWRRFKHQPFE